jgi:hypothetical protein
MRIQTRIPILKVEKSRLTHLKIPASRSDRAPTMNPILAAQESPIFRGALMVHLELARSNVEVLLTAGGLAAKLDARIVGIAACQPMQWAYGDGYSGGTAIVDCQDEL